MIYLWNLLFYKPLYNSLVFLVDVLPNNSLFIAVIILTILVRLIISPLSYKAIRTQLKTKKLQPKLKEIKKTITDKQEQARKTLEVYKKEGINPFSSFLLILVQFPVIIALYWVFRDGGVEIDPELLYSFVSAPESISLTDFGIDLTQKSILLAGLTGLTQYIHLSLSASFKDMGGDQSDKTEQEQMMAMVGKSMKYTMPIMITIFAYIIGGAVALYWVTSNIFMIIQEKVIQNKLKKQS
ncbi:MAG: YidC/Oxa1 family membrane protein insertase [Candidatus Pacebacteria bacterium]|nr:YidC/Oxa1 family membrane protein insertase [Candidatus Paceibacterota bacterium]